ncbi:hypothetical protein H0H92_006868 [Tricholoma furcatifolium]|nr:hypothetical protein H0H92_006868 [Tricholoma furcatifolium]
MSHLSAGQQQAVNQLQAAVHAAADDQAAIDVLDSVGWDVQRAMQRFDIDESDVRRPPTSWLSVLTRPIYVVLAVPFQLFRFVFSLLRIPFRFSFLSLSLSNPRPRQRRFGGPDRWVRELEEETGAVSISSGSSTAIDTPPGLTARARIPDDTKVLPDFTLGTYDQALRICQREARIACIVLVSEEHDDVPEFKSSTLTNPEFVTLLHENNIVVWGGDVRDQEAYSAAEKLQATTYPFVAFLALQPRRSPSSSSSQQPTLTVLSRHQGSSSSSGPTSASTLISHLTTTLLPRVTPFLARIHSAQAERDRERILREEQDAAFRATADRDRARIEALMAAERAAAEEARAAAEAADAEAARQAALSRARETRLVWRRWIRRALPHPPPSAALRIAIRLPDGGRVINAFNPSQSLTALYAYVDAQLVPSDLPTSGDPMSSPSGDAWDAPNFEACLDAQANDGEWWGFRLVSAYPRKEIPWVRGMHLSDIDALKGGGQLVVEMLGNEPSASGDDGYTTESDSDGE